MSSGTSGIRRAPAGLMVSAVLAALTVAVSLPACASSADRAASASEAGTPACCAAAAAIVADLDECCRASFNAPAGQRIGCCVTGLDPAAPARPACCARTLAAQARMPACCRDTMRGDGRPCCRA